MPFTEEPGEAAFYGPKIDFVVKDVIGREWQLGTVQVDYNLPVRFDLTYIGADNQPHRPVMIHRAPFGSHGALLRRPDRALRRRLPALARARAGAARARSATRSTTTPQASLAQLQAAGLRATLDEHSDKLGAKIRRAELEKIPYTLVLGEKEAETQSVSVRSRAKGDEGVLPLADVIAPLQSEVATRALPEKKKV